jgi:hypothetical protein
MTLRSPIRFPSVEKMGCPIVIGRQDVLDVDVVGDVVLSEGRVGVRAAPRLRS